MAGRPKSTRKKVENLELGGLDKIITEKVDKVMGDKYPVAFVEEVIEMRNQIQATSLEEYKANQMNDLRLLDKLFVKRMLDEHKNIPSHRVPAAWSLIKDEINKLEGQPTQRIEVVKKALTGEQWDDLINNLPKPVIDAEVIDAEQQGSDTGSS